MRMYMIVYYAGKMLYGVGPYFDTDTMNNEEQAVPVIALATFTCGMTAGLLDLKLRESFANDRKFIPKELKVDCIRTKGIPDLPSDSLYTIEEFTAKLSE